MQAYLFADDSNDEQVTTLHETGTGELRARCFLTRRLGAFTTDITRRGEARCHRAWFSSSPSLFFNDRLSMLRELVVLFERIEKISYLFVSPHTSRIHSGVPLGITLQSGSTHAKASRCSSVLSLDIQCFYCSHFSHFRCAGYMTALRTNGEPLKRVDSIRVLILNQPQSMLNIRNQRV